MEFDDNEGYESNFTANSEGTFQFDVNSVMFDTTADDNINGEIIEGSDLNVNAAAATKKQRPPSILKGRGRRTFKSSEMLVGAVPKMTANKQFKVIDPITEKVIGWMTYTAKVTNIDYSQCDSLVPNKEPVKDVHCKVNLLHSEELDYRVNLSKRDRIIGGKHLALADGGVNGSIIGLDMKFLYFNDDGKCVSIGIVGDYQLTGNRLCCGYSVAKSSVGWIKLYGPQEAQVKTQHNSVLLVVQMRDNGCLVNDVAI